MRTLTPLLLASVLLLPTAASAADYYVAVGGNNNNSGLSVMQAWATLQFAANRVNPGDTVTYRYEVTNPASPNTSNDLHDIVVTDPGCSPVTYVSGDVGSNGLLGFPGNPPTSEVWVFECTTTLDADTNTVATVTAVVLLQRLPVPFRTLAFVCALVLVPSLGASRARDLGAFGLWESERRFVEIAEFAGSQPESAVFLSMQHAGSVSYYSGRTVLRWDWIEPGEVDRCVDALAASGRRVFRSPMTPASTVWARKPRPRVADRLLKPTGSISRGRDPNLSTVTRSLTWSVVKLPEICARPLNCGALMVGADYLLMPHGQEPHAYAAMVAMSLPWLNPRHREEVREAEHTLAADRHALQSVQNLAQYQLRDAVARFEAARQALAKDQEEGYGLGATSTPSFLVNGRPIAGAQPQQTFADTIEAARRAAGQASGTASAK